jgi:hypothetical protein
MMRIGSISLCAALLLSSGCRTVYVVPVAQRTPSTCGNIRLYGTDNVPFEYEELGVIGLTFEDASQDQCLQAFVSEAQKMGADAILGFRIEPVVFSGGFMLVVCNHSETRLTGVAVRIKRP